MKYTDLLRVTHIRLESNRCATPYYSSPVLFGGQDRVKFRGSLDLRPDDLAEIHKEVFKVN